MAAFRSSLSITGIDSGWGHQWRVLTAERSLTDMDGYLSPEQANGRPLDGRSDIFSLRVVMYDALSGRHANLVCTRSGSSEPAKRGREGEYEREQRAAQGVPPLVSTRRRS